MEQNLGKTEPIIFELNNEFQIGFGLFLSDRILGLSFFQMLNQPQNNDLTIRGNILFQRGNLFRLGQVGFIEENRLLV